MLAQKQSANITFCPTNFAKEAPPMTSPWKVNFNFWPLVEVKGWLLILKTDGNNQTARKSISTLYSWVRGYNNFQCSSIKQNKLIHRTIKTLFRGHLVSTTARPHTKSHLCCAAQVSNLVALRRRAMLYPPRPRPPSAPTSNVNFDRFTLRHAGCRTHVHATPKWGPASCQNHYRIAGGGGLTS